MTLIHSRKWANHYRAYLAFLIFICSTALALSGQTTDVWLGGYGNWANAPRWSAGVPNGNFNVLIDNGNAQPSAVVLNINPKIMNLSIDSDDYLDMNGRSLTVNGTSINNAGVLLDSGTLYIGAVGALINLSGSGSLHMQGGAISSANGQQILTNQSTITGGGSIGGPTLNLLNQGLISASMSGTPLTIATGSLINSNILEATANGGTQLILATAVINRDKGTIRTGDYSKVLSTGGLENWGEIVAGYGSVFTIEGPFSNFSGTTLSRGKYFAIGTLQFNNANIVTNAANIRVVGKIIDQNGNDAFAHFTNNAPKASFDFSAIIVTPNDVRNAGYLKASAGALYSVTYTQSAGTTHVNGTIGAGLINIQAGKVLGKGWLLGPVISSGSLIPGPWENTGTGMLSVGATYTQNASGSLTIKIAGIRFERHRKEYSRLAVSNGVSLSGTLNIKLTKGFVPAIGDKFTILTGSAITGQFTTINGVSINSYEHFQVAYNPTDVTLTVVAGAE